jgi:hypothetical protein
MICFELASVDNVIKSKGMCSGKDFPNTHLHGSAFLNLNNPASASPIIPRICLLPMNTAFFYLTSRLLSVGLAV